MTKDSKFAHISDSASGGKGESMATEIRKDAAKEWLKANQRDFLMRLMRADCPTLGDEIAGYMAKFAESECSRLASRVEELELAFNSLVGHQAMPSGGLILGDCLFCSAHSHKKHFKGCVYADAKRVLAGAHAEEKE